MSAHLPITAASHAMPDTPEHRRFRTLLARVDAVRRRLAAWDAEVPRFAVAHAEQVQPALSRLHARRRELLFELAALHDGRRWSKADAATLGREIADRCLRVMTTTESIGQPPDPEVEALFAAFAEPDGRGDPRGDLTLLRTLFEDVGGVDLGDAPIESMDELMRRAHEDLGRQQAAREAEQAAAEAGRARRRGATRPSAAERRAAEDAQRLSQTVREVFRKLASALHPDRMPADASPEARADRTAQMQRANQAYEANDLLALLTLQLEIEQVDAAHAARVAASQVKHLNRILAEQLRELEAEVVDREMHFCSRFGLMHQGRLHPEKLTRLLGDALKTLAMDEASVQRDRRLLQGGPAQIKRWLQDRRAEHRFDDQEAAFAARFL
jgi:hypothetical protein